MNLLNNIIPNSLVMMKMMNKQKITLYNRTSNTYVDIERYTIKLFNKTFYIPSAFDFIVEKRYPRGQFECLAIVLTLIVLVFNPLYFLVIEPFTISNLLSFLIIQSIMTTILIRPW